MWEKVVHVHILGVGSTTAAKERKRWQEAHSGYDSGFIEGLDVEQEKRDRSKSTVGCSI